MAAPKLGKRIKTYLGVVEVTTVEPNYVGVTSVPVTRDDVGYVSFIGEWPLDLFDGGRWRDPQQKRLL